MDPATDRFIELATRPLADHAELQLAARTELHTRLAGSHAAPGKIAGAADALEHADRHPRRWQSVLFLTTLLVVLPVTAHTVWQLRQFSGVLGFMSPASSDSSFPDLTKGLSPQQKLILQGDKNATTESDRWKPLWESDPDNPAYLLQYAMAYHREHQNLPPEILDTAARIDPDNAWYPVIQAAAMAKAAVTKKSPGYDARKKGIKPTFTVTDEEAFARSLDLLHQSTAKSRLSTNQTDLLKQRVGLLPARRDFASQFPRFVYLSSQSYGTLDFRYLSDAFSIQAGRLAAQNDAAGFHQLVEDWKWLASSTAKDGGQLVDLLVARALFTMPLSDFRDAARTLGLEDEARRFDALNQQEEARRAGSREKSRRSAESYFLETKSSMMAGLTLPMTSRQVSSPPPITEEVLRPGRHADHALFARLHALAACLLFGILAGLSLVRSGPLNLRLASRFQSLLRASDWAWIFLGGIIAPLLWFSLIYYTTPLSARDWGMRITGFLLPAAQLGSLTILMLVTTATIASSRLQERAGFLWLKPRFPMLNKVAIGAAALAIPLVGTLMLLRGGFGHYFFQIGCALSVAALLWWLAGAIRHLLNKPMEGSLRRATLARIMIPAWVFGMLVMIVTVPLHYAEERHWIQQDRLFEITPEAPAPSRYEWDVTQELRKELLELMK